MEDQYSIWTILGYRMMYPIYGTIFILIGLYLSNLKRYKSAKKLMLHKISNNLLIDCLNKYQSEDIVKKYDDISLLFNKIDGFRYFDLLLINWDDDSNRFLTGKLESFFEKNTLIKRKMIQDFKSNSGIIMVKADTGRILGYQISNNLFILVMISKISFPMIGSKI
jgi:hypothetical protein